MREYVHISVIVVLRIQRRDTRLFTGQDCLEVLGVSGLFMIFNTVKL